MWVCIYCHNKIDKKIILVGNKRGGVNRMKSLTLEQRKEFANKGAKAATIARKIKCKMRQALHLGKFESSNKDGYLTPIVWLLEAIVGKDYCLAYLKVVTHCAVVNCAVS